MAGQRHLPPLHAPNAGPSAEYNIASDPKGFDALLRSGAPVVLFPLDSTQLAFEEAARARLFAHGSAASDALALLYHQWRLRNAWGQVTPTLFDAVPTVWLTSPSICRPEPLRLKVDAQGYTRVTPGPPNVRACLTLEAADAQRLIIERLAPEPGPNP